MENATREHLGDHKPIICLEEHCLRFIFKIIGSLLAREVENSITRRGPPTAEKR